MRAACLQHLDGKYISSAENTGRSILLARLCVLVFTYMMFVVPAAVSAEEGNLHIGQLRIHPLFSVSEAFSDNVYYTSTQEKSDSIITYMPGIKLLLPVGRQRAEAQYYAAFNRYNTYKGEDTTDHNASSLLEFKIGSRFGLNLSNVFVKGHEPRSSSATGFTETFRNYAGKISAVYQLAGRSKVEFDIQKKTWDFLQSPFRNRNEDLYAGYIYYRFLPKTSAFFEFDREKVVFDDVSLDLDNTVGSELTGLTWDITENSKGTIKAGYLQKDFESPLRRDFRGWISSVDVRHAFSDYTSLTIIGQRTVNEANVLGTHYFITNGAYAEFTHYLLRKLSATARGSYGVDRYPDAIPPDTTPRKDKTAMGGGGLRYYLRDWLDIGVDYNYRSRHSNIPINDYREHEYLVSISAAR